MSVFSQFTFDDDRDMTGARWSSAVVCPRKAVYEHYEAPEDEHDDPRVHGWRLRGNLIAQAVKRQVIDMLKAEGRRPQFEVEIPWGRPQVGVGHADFYTPHRRTITELYTSAGCEIHPRKVLQLVGYVINHPRAEAGELLIVDPSTGEDRTVPVDIETHRPEVERIIDVVSAGVHDGVLPDRVCKHPGDGPTMFCNRVNHCFQDWVETPLDRVGREFEQLADELLEIKERARIDKANAAQYAARAKEIQGVLKEVIPADGVARAIGTVKVQRTLVPGYWKVSLADMRKAGVEVPELIEPFMKQTADSERWTVNPVK